MWQNFPSLLPRKVCGYLLQKFLGQYVREKITLSQLNISLNEGSGKVVDVSLDCDALNGLAEQYNLPIEFVFGHANEIDVEIPWRNLTTESIKVKTTGLSITVRPKKRIDNGNSMLDSMFTSMASSMQLAEECLKTKTSDEMDDICDSTPSQEPLSGLEYCANTIEAITSRVQMVFENTVVRVEQCQTGSDVGIALEFRIMMCQFKDIKDESDENGKTASKKENTALDEAFSQKIIILEKVSCFSDIFYYDGVDVIEEHENSQEEDEENNSNPIEIGKFEGRHEIDLKIKTDDSIAGPPVTVDCRFGSLKALLTPMQAHLLYNIIDAILSPHSGPSDEILSRNTRKEKPMDTFDFRRFDQEIQEQLQPTAIGISGLNQQQGWSSPNYNDDSDEEFLPLGTQKGNTAMCNSSVSNLMCASMNSMSSSMQESVTESLVSSRVDSSPYKYPPATGFSASNLQSSEKTKFSLSFSSITMILLHEDILKLSSSGTVVPSTLKEMMDCSQKFFDCLNLCGGIVQGKKDVEDIGERMLKACSRSHHRLIVAPVKVEGLVQGTNATTETNGHVTVGFCQLIESLRDKRSMAGTPNPESIEVLTFMKNFESGNNQSIKMTFKTKSHKGRSSVQSKTSLKFNLQECHCEFDLSIVDRINSLLNPILPYYMESKLDPIQNQFNIFQHQKTQSIVKISVKCTCLWLNFRFPIPDLRPLNDANRVPYTIRNVQNDSILIQLNELDFSTVFNSAVEMLEFDTKCHEVRLFYKKMPLEKPTLFATALADDPEVDGLSMRSQGLDWPRIVIWICPERSGNMTRESEFSDAEEPLESFLSGEKSEPSPFSSRRVVHETNSHEDDKESNANESVFPGDSSEMEDFIETTIKNVLIKVELNLRFVEVSFSSKHLFEEIYNRVGNDLLLWEPSYPSNSSDLGPKYMKPAPTMFSMCTSGIRLGPECDIEEEMSAFYTPAAGVSLEEESDRIKQNTFGQSKVAFRMNVEKGIGSFYTPLQDLSGNTVPGQKGQLTIKLQQGSLFVVSGYKGDANLGYLCLTSNKAEMYHSDLIRNNDLHPHLSSELTKTIYPSDQGILNIQTSSSTMTNATDMLSVAIKIERDSDPLKNVKVFKVATGIREGTLDHRIYLPNRSWFTQLTDFFDVTDTPVIGYTPSTVLTELHLHLWNCAVDYKPLNLPIRSILTMDAFSISSNIAAKTNTSVIRFMSENAALNLTTKRDSTNLREDYVCVMDMDFFDLSLRLCANRNSTAPRVNLTATSNALHIRTCSDSFKALMELITYYNNEGDLVDPCQQQETDSDKIQSSPMKASSSEPSLISTDEIPEVYRRLSVSQKEHVHDMVAEAMKDAKPNPLSPELKPMAHSNQKVSSAPTQVYFTQDSEEAYFKQESTSTDLSDPSLMEFNGIPIEIPQSDEDEEPFLILDNFPGTGILPKSGEPEARVLSHEPIRLIENHFASPVGKMDILKPPKHYPNPVMKYSLKEINIIWHIYGGEDFSSSPSRKFSFKSNERGSSETLFNDVPKDETPYYYDQIDQIDMGIDPLSSGVCFSKTNAFESAWETYESPKNQKKHLSGGTVSGKQQGGKGRRHDVLVELQLNKIKFVHEVYPENTEQASRQVLVIKNVEILDKLRSSPFNKMMYMYTSPDRPMQTHANMVVVKAAHIRSDPQQSTEECCLKISILPIRLNMDQDTLLFVYQFFSDLSVKPEFEDDDSLTGRLTNPPSHTPSVESLPIMTVNIADEVGLNSEVEDGSNLLLFNDDAFGIDDTASTCSRDPSIDSTRPSSPIYFRQIIFSPEVVIRFDYRGKRVDTTHGNLAGLLMGLAQLNNSEICLKRICHRHGILGIDRLVAFLINEWVVDIKKTQVPRVLGGIGPVYSLVQLFQGFRDLFWLPIEQYQKDGRITKGLQRGVNAFSTSTAMAALELTNKFILTIQGVAEFTYDMVSPGPSVQQKRRESSKRRKRYNQPGDIREGMTNAYNVVREGLGDTAHTIVRVASREHEKKGLSGAVGGVIRQIPPTVVRPIILAAEATSNVLDGFRSQLEPEFKKENEKKWKDT